MFGGFLGHCQVTGHNGGQHEDRSHDEAMAELFKEDPAFAAEYLNQLLQDGEPVDLLVALRQMAQARGGVRAIAKETELNAN